MKSFFHIVLYQPLYNLLIWLAWIVPGHSIGWAIIILTVLIRLLLLPSSIKAAHLQVKNMEMQPKINKIRAEITDQKEQSAALMALYKEENFSPFGSCLPILVQLPILWVLFAVFRSGLNANGFKDLYPFVHHAATMNTMFFGVNLVTPDKWILPIAAGLLQFVLSTLMMPKSVPVDPDAPKDPMAAMSKQMLYLPSIITIFFGRTMPAALVIYWITTTVFGIFQQLYVNKEIKKAKAERAQMIESGILPKAIQIEPPKATKAELTIDGQSESPKAKKNDMMANLMKKRLDKQEKKAGVNVTVRMKGK
jgi:YidC/Oxa1 family membrane protein insertase